MVEAEIAPDFDLAVQEAMKKNTVEAFVVVQDNTTGRRRLYMAIFAMIVLALAVFLALYFSLRPPTKEKTPSPSSAPSPAPSQAPTHSPTLSKLSNLNLTIAMLLDDTSFPSSESQRKALEWLAQEDTEYQEDSDELLERYIAVLFYMTTNGDGWINKKLWLSIDHVCDWHGMQCNEANRIIRIDLGKCISSLCFGVERRKLIYCIIALLGKKSATASLGLSRARSQG
jgi:hypothetical protein